MRDIVNAYAKMLTTPDSLTVFNDLQYGWMSTCAKKVLDISQYILPNASGPSWGFKSFNDFFKRDIKDIQTTRPCDENKNVLSSFGDVAMFAKQTNVTLDNQYYLKNESYSLLQMFNYKEDIAKQFVGGAIL